jgi:hypothetical protein
MGVTAHVLILAGAAIDHNPLLRVHSKLQSRPTRQPHRGTAALSACEIVGGPRVTQPTMESASALPTRDPFLTRRRTPAVSFPLRQDIDAISSSIVQVEANR